MMGKISASLCVLALILFVFPWLGVSCNGKSIGTQRGYEIMYGGFSESPDMGQMKGMLGGGDSADQEQADKDKPSWSLLTVLAFLAVLGSAVIAVAGEVLALPLSLNPGLKNILESVRRLPVKVGLLTGIAFVLLLFTWVVGFPVEHKVREARADMAKQSDSDMPIQMTIEVHYLFPLYLEMLVLIPPTFLMLNDKFKWVSLSGMTGGSPQPSGGTGPAAGAASSGEGEAPTQAEPPPKEEPPA